jgi:hypothetical protein
LNGPKTGPDFSVADLKGGEGKNGIFENLFRREWEAEERMERGKEENVMKRTTWQPDANQTNSRQPVA